MSSLKTTRRWAMAPQNPALADELAQGLGVKPLVARIMVAHGIGLGCGWPPVSYTLS